MNITWKEVLDCKYGATPTISHAECLADNVGYEMFCFNDRVYGKAIVHSHDKKEKYWVELPFIRKEEL